MTKRSLSELSDEDCSEYENGSDYENGPSENEAEEDSATLRELVRKKDAEISDLKAQVKKLKTEVKNAAGSLQPATNLVMGSEAAAAQAETLRASITKMLASQMAYKKQAKNASLMSAEIPSVPEPVVAALFGNWKAKSTSKTVKPSKRLDLDVPGKSLRFGACLQMVPDSQTATWTRDGGMLRVRAKYSMVK